MFGFVQNNRIIISIILGTIALTFVTFGLSKYQDPSVAEDYLAKVGNAQISQKDLDIALMKQPHNPSDQKARDAVLERLINEQLILQDAKQNGISVSKKQITEFISSIPVTQENGKFSSKQYLEFLNSRGLTAQEFESQITKLMLLQTQISHITSAQIVAKEQSSLIASVLGTVRSVRLAIVSPKDFAKKVNISDAALKDFYEKNLKQYRSPEAVKVQFLVLSQQKLADTLTLSDNEVKSFYDEHKQVFSQPQRYVSHILLQVPQGASMDEKAKIKVKAEQLLAKAKASPSNFSLLAKDNSQDQGSAAAGGRLGIVSRGMTVKPFEDAVFAMTKSGQISGIIETQFGFHIIKLDELKIPDFDEVKQKVESFLKTEKSSSLYIEKLGKLQELAYKNNNLDQVANSLGLQTENSDWIARNSSSDPRLGNPKVMEQIFSDDLLKNKQNSTPIDIGNKTSIVMHIADHRAERQLSFDEAKLAINAKLTYEEGSKLAAEHGAAELKALREANNKGSVDIKWSEQPVNLNIANNMNGFLSQEELAAIFSAQTKNLPTYVGNKRKDGSYVLFKIESVKSAPNSDNFKTLSTELNTIHSETQLLNYLSELRKRFPVVMVKGK